MAKTLKTTDFDAVISSVPVNKTAARMMSGGVHYTPHIKDVPTMPHSDLPLPTISRPREVGMRRQYDRMVGKKFGRWLVIGLAPTRKVAWVVRCLCGRYEHRKTLALERAENTEDVCRECAHLRSAKWKYKNFGSRSVEDFVPSVPTPLDDVK